jgi:CNT family concentrative nucleoside transporter
LLARIMVPEAPGAVLESADMDDLIKYESSMDAIGQGVSDGLQVALNVGATLIVFVSFAAIANGLLGALPPVWGAALSVQRILGWIFSPLAFAIGVPWKEAAAAGNLLGVKLVLTEIVAFIDLAKSPELSERTRILMTYALCGFANIGSVGISVSGFSVLMPARRREILALAWRALFAGFLATCMTAALVGALPARLFGL